MSQNVKAQTSLNIGDIAFTGYNADGNDSFSIIILRPGGLASGTAINFTNRGWNSNTSTYSASGQTITLTLSGAQAQFSQITIGQSTAYQSGTTTSVGTITGTALSLAAGGDCILAYQNTSDFKAAVHMNVEEASYCTLGVGSCASPGTLLTTTSDWDGTNAAGTDESDLPAGLTNGVNCVWLYDPTGLTNSSTGLWEVDNARLKASALTGTAAQILAAANDRANWEFDNATAFNPTAPVPTGTTPLTLISFNAKCLDNKAVELNWTTAEEVNVSKIIVEYSSDSKDFISIAQLQPSNQPGMHQYSYVHQTSPDGNILYYRLRLEDRDGHYKYSRLAKLDGCGVNGVALSLYPNPVNDILQIAIGKPQSGKYRFEVRDSKGLLVWSRQYQSPGSVVNVNLQHLPAGTYVFLAVDPAGSRYQQVIIRSGKLN